MFYMASPEDRTAGRAEQREREVSEVPLLFYITEKNPFTKRKVATERKFITRTIGRIFGQQITEERFAEEGPARVYTVHKTGEADGGFVFCKGAQRCLRVRMGHATGTERERFEATLELLNQVHGVLLRMDNAGASVLRQQLLRAIEKIVGLHQLLPHQSDSSIDLSSLSVNIQDALKKMHLFYELLNAMTSAKVVRYSDETNRQIVHLRKTHADSEQWRGIIQDAIGRFDKAQQQPRSYDVQP